MQASTSSSNNLTTLATDQNGSSDKHPSGSSVGTIFKRYFDVAVVCVVIAVVWALLALPTVFYHLPQVDCVSLVALCMILIVLKMQLLIKFQIVLG